MIWTKEDWALAMLPARTFAWKFMGQPYDNSPLPGWDKGMHKPQHDAPAPAKPVLSPSKPIAAGKGLFVSGGSILDAINESLKGK
jgi:hypothetical protein